MSPLCKNSVSWLYRLDEHHPWKCGLTFDRDYVYYDAKKEKVRLIIEAEGWITVMKGYSWNGCSPKFCLFDLNIGTPDGVVHKCTGRPKTYYASLVHDALYQFLREKCPVSRRQADAFFLQLMKDDDFCLRHIYWLGVRLFGWIVWAGKKSKRKWKSKVFYPAEAAQAYQKK